MTTGFVSLVGAGPGSPDLLTIRAARAIEQADLVLADGLVPPEVLEGTRGIVRRVAKRAGAPSVSQEEIVGEMIAAARAGLRVVRLKCGDPFVFGRGGEEALALRMAGVPFEVVPGVTAAVAAPAVEGIPVTHRGITSAFVVVSGHSEAAYGPVLESLAPRAATIVVLMGLATRASIAALLIARGWPADTPAAVLAGASTAQSRTWTGRLERLGAAPFAPHDRVPATIVIGDVVSLRDYILPDAACGAAVRREQVHTAVRR